MKKWNKYNDPFKALTDRKLALEGKSFGVKTKKKKVKHLWETEWNNKVKEGLYNTWNHNIRTNSTTLTTSGSTFAAHHVGPDTFTISAPILLRDWQEIARMNVSPEPLTITPPIGGWTWEGWADPAAIEPLRVRPLKPLKVHGPTLAEKKYQNILKAWRNRNIKAKNEELNTLGRNGGHKVRSIEFDLLKAISDGKSINTKTTAYNPVTGEVKLFGETIVKLGLVSKEVREIIRPSNPSAENLFRLRLRQLGVEAFAYKGKTRIESSELGKILKFPDTGRLILPMDFRKRCLPSGYALNKEETPWIQKSLDLYYKDYFLFGKFIPIKSWERIPKGMVVYEIFMWIDDVNDFFQLPIKLRTFLGKDIINQNNVIDIGLYRTPMAMETYINYCLEAFIRAINKKLAEIKQQYQYQYQHTRQVDYGNGQNTTGTSTFRNTYANSTYTTGIATTSTYQYNPYARTY